MAGYRLCGGTGWQDEERELLSTWKSSRNVRSCAWDRQGARGSFGVKIVGQTSTGDVTVGVCWGLPGQGKLFSDSFTSTCPGPCERLEPPLDGLKRPHSRTQELLTTRREDHVRKEKAWGSKQ